ncbi:MAG: GNAT family N-acetyltransferase [Oscillospiraceae bacterium]|nr:GNAT family N-acetyltransferase [Oscillospiraceae bacterium]
MEIKSFTGLVPDALYIRITVFVKEQGFVDEEDEIDPVAIHLVAYDEGKPIATCRFFKEPCGEDFILGRLCVLKEKRGAGIGARLLSEAEKGAKAIGAKSLKLHSQLHARAFYEKCGYKQVGEIELEQGKEHIWMKKEL